VHPFLDRWQKQIRSQSLDEKQFREIVGFKLLCLKQKPELVWVLKELFIDVFEWLQFP
jgi:hypothetical protein